jgi:hypothetical protein
MATNDVSAPVSSAMTRARRSVLPCTPSARPRAQPSADGASHLRVVSKAVSTALIFHASASAIHTSAATAPAVRIDQREAVRVYTPYHALIQTLHTTCEVRCVPQSVADPALTSSMLSTGATP